MHSNVLSIGLTFCQTPAEQLATQHGRIVSILYDAAQSANSLGDTNSWLRLSKHALEVMRAAIPNIQNDLRLRRIVEEVAVTSEALIGAALLSQGQTEEALSYLEAGYARAARLGNHPQQHDLAALLGCVRVAYDDIDGTTAMLKDAVANLSDTSPSRTMALVGLLRCYQALGAWSECRSTSEELMHAALRSGQTGIAIGALSTQAGASFQKGDFAVAEDDFRLSLAMLEASTNQLYLDKYIALVGLAKSTSCLDRFEESAQALRAAHELLPFALAGESIQQSNIAYAAFLSIGSGLLSRMQQPEMALALERERNALLLAHAPEDAERLAESFIALGRSHTAVGHLGEAEECYKQAESQLKRQKVPNAAQELDLLDSEAALHAGLGNVEKAIQFRERLSRLAKEKFGESDPYYYQNLAMLAENLIAVGQSERAGGLCVQSQRLFIEVACRNALRIPFGADAGAVTRSLMPALACTAAQADPSPTVATNAALILAISKGLHSELFELQAAIGAQRTLKEDSELLHALWISSLHSTNAQVLSDAIMSRGEAASNILNRVLSAQITFDSLSRSIPSRGCLLDFVEWRRWPGSGPLKLPVLRMAVLASFASPSGESSPALFLDLGEAAPINDAVELVCKRMSAGQFEARDLSPALKRLSELVWAPLASHLTNVSHLLVCPDGQLSRLPFEMLPVGDKFLIEEKSISYVTSGREVVRLAVPLTPPAATLSPSDGARAGREGGGKPLVMGNPDFDLDLGSARGPSAVVGGAPATSTNMLLAGGTSEKGEEAGVYGVPRTLPNARSLSRDYRGLKFTPLPGSGAEATNVAKLLGDDAVLLLGPEAREAELKAVVSPRVLHLATHGFFLSDQELKYTNSLLSLEQAGRLRYFDTDPHWENPLRRCGIALAGANHARQITDALAEDGLLTGLEAALLNLQGTELAILSACDSGSGEVKIGEGVMSLRRAFRIAGAETVLASHWKVSDRVTGQLMTEFMRRWRSGEPRAQAWHEAQLSLLRSKEFSNPWFWAAFTLTGQWK